MDAEGVHDIVHTVYDLCHALNVPSYGGRVMNEVERLLATGEGGGDLAQIGWFVFGRLRDLAMEVHDGQGGGD